MTETCDILNFIEANPDSDTVRLAYADFLTEDEASNPIRPHCEECNGTGWEREGVERCGECLGVELDKTRSARAELIRVQCELYNKPACPDWCTNDPEKCRVAWLEKRESELLREYAAKFRSGPECEACDKGVYKSHEKSKKPYSCEACHGTGDAGGLMRRNSVYHRDDGTYGDTCWEHTVDFVRGFPRVRCRMEECVKEVWNEDHSVSGSPTRREVVGPSDWLLSVVRHHRGVEVWVTDRVPHLVAGLYTWYDGRGTHGPDNGHHIPAVLWDAMPKSPPTQYNIHLCGFPTAEAAHVALARAIPAWARG